MPWAGTVLVLAILMRVSSFTWTDKYTIDMIAVTRRVCQRRGRSGSAGIRRRAPRCVLLGSLWLSVLICVNLERFGLGVAKSTCVVCDRCQLVKLRFHLVFE